VLPEQDGSEAPEDAPVAVKEAVLPFKRFRDRSGEVVDSLLGPEMRSTGEVMGIDRDFPRAFAKSQEAASGGLPLSGTVFVSVSDRDKRSVVLPALRLAELGFTLLATAGTAEVLHRNGIRASVVRKLSESGEVGPDVVDLISRGRVDVVINTPSGRSARADGYEIRAAAVAADKPLFTTVAQLTAAVASIEAIRAGFDVTALQTYERRREQAAAGRAER
jgi:carbamoyl-phosphate synthase large subunit